VKVEAAERGISAEQVLTEMRESDFREQVWKEQRERELAQAERRRSAILTATAVTATGFFVIAFKRRHWVVEVASRWCWVKGELRA
jgi:hypothetical protein